METIRTQEPRNPRTQEVAGRKKRIKFSILLFLSSCVLVFLCSCHKPAATGQKQEIDPNAIQVQLVDANSFPQEMVGSWYNEQYGWILKFEKDGRILDITHTIGRQDVSAGKISRIPLKQNGAAVFEPGPWLVRYTGTTRELLVEITLTSFDYKMVGNHICGSSRDIFIGTPPKTDEIIWRANWISFPEYVTSTADKKYKDYRVPVELENEDKGEIVFVKFNPKIPQSNQ